MIEEHIHKITCMLNVKDQICLEHKKLTCLVTCENGLQVICGPVSSCQAGFWRFKHYSLLNNQHFCATC